MIEIEIVNPNGTVSYRRPQGHPDVAEALHTTGYHIRFTLPAEVGEDGTSEENIRRGFRIAGVPVAMLETDDHAFGVNRDTRRMYIWCAMYEPTMDEYRRANDWAYNHQPEPARDDR